METFMNKVKVKRVTKKSKTFYVKTSTIKVIEKHARTFGCSQSKFLDALIEEYDKEHS